MGGHAFPRLHCPRMPRDVYLKIREQATEALSKLFAHVVVPTEMPDKVDYGDIDILVSGFFSTTSNTSDNWPAMVTAISSGFNTTHCQRGFLNPSIIFSAIPAGGEKDFWVQIDVKVLEKADEQTFAWNQLQLNYASGSKMLGSLIKPLGMTIGPEGLHIRVEEMEQTNFPGSMVFVSKEPWDLLKIVGLDRRFLYGGFTNNEEIYKYFASSWIFNPAHFAARMEDEKFVKHLEERSASWVHFLTEWTPTHYPNYSFSDQNIPLPEWYKTTRAAIREKVFTLFPSLTAQYYEKRANYLKGVEELRLREVLMKAIPAKREGWSEDLPHPRVIVKSEMPATPPMRPKTVNDKLNSQLASDGVVDTPPSMPFLSMPITGDLQRPLDKVLDTPIYLAPLPRDPPLTFTAHPPSSTMSIEAKLVCIARWTLFSPSTGLPYLAREPREKKFEMCWSEHGVCDEVLVAWAKEMWWGIWVRQALVNYVGMWKRRFEKEDAKATKAEELTAKTQQEPKSDAVAVEVVERTAVRDQMEKAREELDAEIKARKEKIRARLEAFEA